MNGFEYWGARQSGYADLGQIALGIIESAEGAAKGYVFNGQAAHDVDVLYHVIFNRVPDAGGTAFWTHLIDNGTVTLVGVADALLASSEMDGHKLASVDWSFLV